MALDDPGEQLAFEQAWLDAMGAGAPAPLGIAEYGVLGSTAPTPVPPPPPPPPPPQKVGEGMEPIEEVAAPITPGPALPIDFDESAWRAFVDPQSAPELAPVGSVPAVDAFGQVIEDAPLGTEPSQFGAQPGLGVPAEMIADVAPAPPVGGAPRTDAAPGELPLDTDELLALAHRDPVAYARYNAEQDERAAAMVRQRQAELAKADAERAEGEWRDYQDAKTNADRKMAQLEADAATLANEKPNGYFDSIGNAIGAVVGVVLGALGSTGGQENPAIRSINANIERHIQAQREEYARKGAAIDRRMNVIARLREQGYSDYQAASTFRIAALSRAREQMLAEAQNYDPRGTNARKIAAAQLGVEQQMRASFEAARRQQFDDDLKIAKEAREQGEYAMKLEKHNRAMVGAGGGKKSPAHYEALGLRPPPVEMTDKEYKAWLGSKKAGEELTKAEQEAVAGRSQGMSKEELERGIGGLKQDDGRPYVAQGTPEAVEALRKKDDATRTVVRIIDQIQRTRTGWSPDIVKSTEWKQLKADWAAAKGVAKDALGLGALSGPDEKLIENYLGGLDPTGIRDPAPGLERARQNMINMTRDALKSRGFTGKYEIAKPKLDAPTATPSDEAFRLAQKKPSDTDLIERAPGFKVGRGETVLDYAGKNFVLPGQAVTYDNVVLPEVRREIDALAAKARSAEISSDRDEALAKLQSLVNVGGNAGTKAAATAALESVGRPAESYEDITGKRQQGARETVPPLQPSKTEAEKAIEQRGKK